jgi:hypothetical protein
VLTIAAVEKICDAHGVTLVMHPAVRKALGHYQDSFYIGACRFLQGETDGLCFLPVAGGGLVPLRFSKRLSAAGHPILRIDPIHAEGLACVRAQAMQVKSRSVS